MSFGEKVAFLFPGDENRRVSFRESSFGDLFVSIDVHGLTCRQAERAIRNLINIARRPLTLTVVHGYRHGTAIRDMIRYRLDSGHIQARYPDIRNPGVTHLAIV